jgi:hypothetical protein
VRDGDGGPVRSAPFGDVAVLGTGIAALGPCRGSGSFDQRSPQLPISLVSRASSTFQSGTR